MSAIKTFLLEAIHAGADPEAALRGIESGELLWAEAIEQACPPGGRTPTNAPTDNNNK